MMKQVFLVLMMMFSFCFKGQIIIDGYISNREDNTPISNCLVYLKTETKMIIITKTDSCGYYSFSIYNPNFNQAVIQVIIDRHTKTPTAQYGFLATEYSEPYKTDISTRRNFELTPLHSCDPFPQNLIFKKNQTSFDTIYPIIENEVDSSIFLPEIILFKYKDVLKRNPNIIIEISGHCSTDEKNVEQISLLRTQKIKEELVKFGVNEKRIICKGYGVKKLKVQNSVIKKAKTKEEKEDLHAINRRCVFKILSWDFDDGTTKKEIPTYKPPVEEEEKLEEVLPIKPD